MVDIVILCPLAVEYKAVRQLLEKPVEIKHPSLNQHFEFGYVSGRHHSWKISLFEVGPKIENLGAVTGKIIDVLQPSYIFLVGVAGGVKDVAIGDVVVATAAYGYDSGKETPDGFIVRPDVVPYSKQTIEICRSLKRRNADKKPYRIVPGPIASGNKVLTSTNGSTYQIIKTHYEDTVAVEMEAIGFAKAAFDRHVQFANIRGISDLLENKTESDKMGTQELASVRAADFLRELINALPRPARTWPNKHFKVNYLKSKPGWLTLRRPQTAEAVFNGLYMKMEMGDRSVIVQDIKDIRHLAMPGDLFRNWVELEFREGDEWSTIYLSSVQPVGLGYWRGGSTDLLAYLTPFKKTISAG